MSSNTPFTTHTVRVVDSHTGGEPTRVVTSGLPDLGQGSMAERLALFRDQHDRYRSAIVNEPRGSDVVVGAALLHPVDASCAAGVVFFNNVGYLGMCGHGSIGVIATLSYLGRIKPGHHKLETPVGTVTAVLHTDGSVSVENVPSYRKAKGVTIDVPGIGKVTGDVAWGGNWFFLSEGAPVPLLLEHREALTEYTWAIRQALRAQGVTGPEGQEIDHVEVFADVTGSGSRNFVLCPGKAYDRSPCGTGTSAKLACLAADGKMEPGAVWRQEGILGTAFEGSYRLGGDGAVIPSIRGRAFITATSRLLLDPEDPFRAGIPS